MAASLSLDLRRRVLAAVAEGLSHRAAGARFAVSAASISRGARWSASKGTPDRKPWAETRDPITSTPTRTRSLRLSVPSVTGRSMKCAPFCATRTAWSLASARSSASSNATRSRAKKDGARHGARPPGHPETTRGLVRWPTRPRSGAPRLHRRDLGHHEHGSSARSLPAR